ncbi:hypothetical protein [Dactylosporangium sp. NPDC005555]|uniref:hypothetical protein n=1 Tax=Dactylosporangium sp. NPDC005555 TaxID=3154889 RepID=UPI0033A60E77
MAVGVDEAPAGWVPVEHRWFGLDRRTLGPGLIALVLALLLIYGWSALNAVIPWHNEIRAGDVLDLGDGATAVPPVGWQLESGVLTGAAGVSATGLQVVLVNGGARIELTGSTFAGTADAFLTQVRRARGDDSLAVQGGRASLTTGGGLVGVVQGDSGPGGDGLDVAFKMATGPAAEVQAAPALLVVVRAAPGQFEHYHGEVQAMLHSITPGARR